MEQFLHRTADESTYYSPSPQKSLLGTTTKCYYRKPPDSSSMYEKRITLYMIHLCSSFMYDHIWLHNLCIYNVFHSYARHVKFQAKLLDYVLWSNKCDINQIWAHVVDIRLEVCVWSSLVYMCLLKNEKKTSKLAFASWDLFDWRRVFLKLLLCRLLLVQCIRHYHQREREAAYCFCDCCATILE